MIKRFLSLFLTALAFMSVVPKASAQAYDTWAFCGGGWRLNTCSGPTQAQIAANQQYSHIVPLQGMPGVYQQGNNLFRCSTGSRVLGGLLGAGVGYVIGKNITMNGHRLNSLGAIAGGGLGQQISCEMMGSVSAPPQQRPLQNTFPVIQGSVLIPAEQQVGGIDSNVNQTYLPQTQRGRTISEPSDCDVGIQKNLKGLTAEQCQRIREVMTVKKPSECAIGGMKSQEGLSPEECGRIREAMTVNRPGHCRIGGVDYPEFIDNEPGCLGKRAAIIQASRQASATQITSAQQPVAASEVQVDSSKGTSTPDVCAWVHPDTKQRFDKPQGDSRSCISFVQEVAGKNGFTLATRQ